MLALAINTETKVAQVKVDDIKKEIGRIAQELIKLISETEQKNTSLTLSGAFLAAQRLLYYRNTFSSLKGVISLYGKDESLDKNGTPKFANYTGIFPLTLHLKNLIAHFMPQSISGMRLATRTLANPQNLLLIYLELKNLIQKVFLSLMTEKLKQNYLVLQSN